MVYEEIYHININLSINKYDKLVKIVEKCMVLVGKVYGACWKSVWCLLEKSMVLVGKVYGAKLLKPLRRNDLKPL